MTMETEPAPAPPELGDLIAFVVKVRAQSDLFDGVVFAISAPVSQHPPLGLLRCLGT
jgi:hypothetical protein